MGCLLVLMLLLPVKVVEVAQAEYQEDEAGERGEPEDGQGVAEQHGRNRSGEA